MQKTYKSQSEETTQAILFLKKKKINELINK